MAQRPHNFGGSLVCRELVIPQVLAGAGAATSDYADLGTSRRAWLMLEADLNNNAHDVTTMELSHCETHNGTFTAHSAVIANMEGDGAYNGGIPQLVEVPDVKRFVKLTWTDAGGALSYFAAYIVGGEPTRLNPVARGAGL